MWLAGANGSLGRPRGEVALLLLASLCIVLALVIVVAAGPAALSNWRTTFTLALSVAAGGSVLATAMALATMTRNTSRGRATPEEIDELRKTLLTAESIIKAEPQVLVFWEHGQGVRV